MRNRPRQAQGWRWAKKTGEKGTGRKVRGKSELREAGGRRRDLWQEQGDEFTYSTQETSSEGLCASALAVLSQVAWSNEQPAPAHQSHCEEATSVKFLSSSCAERQACGRETGPCRRN